MKKNQEDVEILICFCVYTRVTMNILLQSQMLIHVTI